MGTISGSNLLQAVLDAKQVGLLPAQQVDLENALQELIDAGQDTAFALADVMGINPQISGSLEEGELLAVIVNDAIEEVEDPVVAVVDIDAGTIGNQAVFDAAGGAFDFRDDAAIAGNVLINNFSSDDVISIKNADVGDYSFSSEGEDAVFTYNYMDEGTMNIIQLAGVVTEDALVYDQASFADAVGFDAFNGG
jgi:hypothetical protein